MRENKTNGDSATSLDERRARLKERLSALHAESAAYVPLIEEGVASGKFFVVPLLIFGKGWTGEPGIPWWAQPPATGDERASPFVAQFVNERGIFVVLLSADAWREDMRRQEEETLLAETGDEEKEIATEQAAAVPIPPLATAREAAAWAIASGIAPEPIVGKDVLKGQALSKLLTAVRSLDKWDELWRRNEFKALKNGVAPAVGFRTGGHSGGLVDVDLDAKSDGAFRAMSALVDEVLRLWGVPYAAFGRRNRPRNHRMLLAGSTGTGGQFGLPGLAIEVRGNNKHTVVPPSVHAASGEALEWASEEIPRWDGGFASLVDAARLVAFLVAVLDRFGRPGPEGNQHDLSLPLAGALLRSAAFLVLPPELADERAEALLEAFFLLTGEAPAKCREHARGAVCGFRDREARGEAATGLPRLVEVLSFREAEKEELRKCLLSDERERPATAEQREHLLDPSDKVGNALLFRAKAADTYRYTDAEGGMIYDGETGLYVPASPVALGTRVQSFLHASARRGKRGPIPFHPSRDDQEQILYALNRLEEVYAGPAPLRVGWIPEAPLPEGIDAAWHVVPVQNGLLCVSPGGEEVRLAPFTPSYRAKSKIAAPWDPAAECPAWRRAIDGWWPGDEDGFLRLHEFIGYTLTPWYGVHAVLVLVGVAGGGKGTLIRAWRHLLGGDDGSSTKNLASFSEKYALAGVPGKRAIFVTDAEERGKLVDVPAFCDRCKAISGNDPVPVREMNRAEYDYVMEAKIVVACNAVPNVFDPAGALADRFRFMEFVRKYRNTSDQDPRLSEKLEAEMSGILRLAVEGLLRVLREGRIAQPKCGEAEAARFADDSNPYQEFGRRFLAFEPEAWVDKDDAYQAWCEWRRREGLEPRSKINFIRRMNVAFRGSLRESDRERVPGWKGANLRPTTDGRRGIDPPF